MSGWIKIHRKMLDWGWYDDTNTFRLFLHLLLKANHKANQYHGHEIPIGSLVASYATLAKQANLTPQQVRTVLDKLKSTSEITIKTTNKFTIISITNWSLYQAEQQAEQQTSNKQVTNKQQTSNNTIRMKEDKNERREEDNNPPIVPQGFNEFWDLYPRKKNKIQAMKAYQRATKGTSHETIITSLRSHVAIWAEWPDDQHKFIPHASTWLNQQSWEGDLPDRKHPAPKAANRSPGYHDDLMANALRLGAAYRKETQIREDY